VALVSDTPQRKLLVFILGGFVLWLLGSLDDRLSPELSLLLRVTMETAVAIPVYALAFSRESVSHNWIYALLTVLFLVLLVNSFNLIDNMDGIAASTAAVTGTALVIAAQMTGRSAVALFAASLVGASLAFLRYNMSQAREYLGNGGSLMVGWLLATLSLEATADPVHWKSLLLATGFLIVPVTDTALVVVSRLHAHRSLLQAGVDHIGSSRSMGSEMAS
jgi:UDP-GlcNAc:undecaprenyl-phosphate/decaprenyl-phosphate GlcNAc-1-phosphate transferase